MKKTLTICIFTVLTNLLVAQISKSVNMTTAGTLSSLLTNSEKIDVTNLTITGYIDARDVKFMRDNMMQLTDIDISNTSILAYSGTDGTTGISENVYPANTMPEYAFCPLSGSSQLSNIELPNSIISIGDYAFCLCTNLKSLILPSNITEIGHAAISFCNNLTSITLPSSLKIIKDMAFTGSSNLSSITLPPLVTTLGVGIFDDCTNLNSIYSQNPEPPTCQFMSFGDPFMKKCFLYVPVGSITNYQQATIWKDFSNIFETTTALDQLNNHQITIFTKNSEIIIEGPLDGEIIDIYTENGIKFGTVKSDSNTLIIKVKPHKLYLVHILGVTYKVICN